MEDMNRQTILIVDDNQDSRELVVKVLKNKGYETVEAVDGEDALQKVRDARPALILMDISLPKMDGYEVSRRLKAMEEYREIPIVALTAHAMKGDEEKAYCAGCAGYITKPVDVRKLPEQIRAYLKDAQRRNGASDGPDS